MLPEYTYIDTIQKTNTRLLNDQVDDISPALLTELVDIHEVVLGYRRWCVFFIELDDTEGIEEETTTFTFLGIDGKEVELKVIKKIIKEKVLDLKIKGNTYAMFITQKTTPIPPIKNEIVATEREIIRYWGHLLGYPECCVRKFSKHKTFGFPMAGGATFWAYSYNIGQNYFSPEIGHVPCSKRCKETLVRMGRRREIIKKMLKNQKIVENQRDYFYSLLTGALFDMAHNNEIKTIDVIWPQTKSWWVVNRTGGDKELKIRIIYSRHLIPRTDELRVTFVQSNNVSISRPNAHGREPV